MSFFFVCKKLQYSVMKKYSLNLLCFLSYFVSFCRGASVVEYNGDYFSKRKKKVWQNLFLNNMLCSTADVCRRARLSIPHCMWPKVLYIYCFFLRLLVISYKNKKKHKKRTLPSDCPLSGEPLSCNQAGNVVALNLQFLGLTGIIVCLYFFANLFIFDFKY